MAPDLLGKGAALHEAVEGGSALLAVCGGYQLLGRSYRTSPATTCPGSACCRSQTVAGSRRMIGDVLLECSWAGRTLAGFENHAGRTILDPGAEPLGRVVSGFGNDGTSGAEGCRRGRVYGTYLHGPLLPGTRGSPTGCWQRRSRMRPAASPRSSSRYRTCSSSRPTRSRPRAPAHAAASASDAQSAPR